MTIGSVVHLFNKYLSSICYVRWILFRYLGYHNKQTNMPRLLLLKNLHFCGQKLVISALEKPFQICSKIGCWMR